MPFYTWTDGDGEQMAVGLKGHVMGAAFPEGYSNWQETDLHDLIDAELVPEPTDKNVVKAVRKLAKEADSVVIATDFDREGELIGLEALAEVLEVNPDDRRGRPRRAPAGQARPLLGADQGGDRARLRASSTSSPTTSPTPAQTRQDIDLIWGATLTRAVSLATRRFGSNFLSVGRVQSPTLALIVERELERRAHVPKPFWEVFAKLRPPRRRLRGPPQDRQVLGEAPRPTPRSPRTKSPGVVNEVTLARNQRKPPTPYNTTAFTTDASSRLGITPSSAMRIAEDLYMDGFISYPRTDNTVYPPSLPRASSSPRWSRSRSSPPRPRCSTAS